MKATAVIKKVGDKYVIYSKTGKKLGTFDSKKAAEKRLREIEYFKHKSGGQFRLDLLEALSR